MTDYKVEDSPAAAVAAAVATAVAVEIQKPQNDERSYRYLCLENRMRVVLISDPETDKSAAAVNVHVGHFQDPANVAGLAHFCEHMSFMGSEKYPDEEDYHKFISKHGGHTNAFTDTEDTNYFFDISKEYLEPALDRLAQFFIRPLFTNSATSREMQAVHSEHQKNLQNDFWRVFQFMKSTSSTQHPFSKFGTGDLETLDEIPRKLGIDLREELLAFHQRYYSSNIMSLCVVGKESLDQLEEWVRSKFSAVVDKNVQLPSYSEVPVVEQQHLRKLYRIQPVKDLKEVNLIFPCTHYPAKWYTKKPSNIISHLVGHEGEGSVFSFLKQKGWVSALSAGGMFSFTDQSFFSISIEMTDEGESHYMEIVEIVFAYLNMLRQRGVDDWIFEECRDLAETSFRFKEKSPAASHASHLATNLLKYAPEHVMSGDYRYFEYDREVLRALLEKDLVPQNVIVHYMSKSNATTDSALQERWYKTPYTEEDLSEQVLQQWARASVPEGIKLPSRNMFVPSNFDIKGGVNGGAADDDLDAGPKLILENAGVKLWHKLDRKFNSPKATLICKMVTPLQFSSPQSVIMTEIFNQLVKDKLNEFAYAAHVAGLDYDVKNSGTEGIAVSIGGYNDKLSVLRRKIFETLGSAEWFLIERFDVIKEKIHRDYRNFLLEQPYQHVVAINDTTFNSKLFTMEDLLSVIGDITFVHFTRFVPVLLQSLQMELFLHGNLTVEEALQEAREVESTMCKDRFGLLDSQLPGVSILQLPGDKTDAVFQRKSYNPDDNNSAIEIMYQVGLRSTKSDMILHTLAKIMQTPYFDQLRTKEQIGYIVFSRPVFLNNVCLLSLILQSSEKSSKYMLERSDSFLADSFLNYLRTEITDDEFKSYVQSQVEERKQKDKRLLTESQRHWREITSRQYEFGRRQKEIDALNLLTKAEIIEFYERYIMLGSAECRRMVSCVFSHAASDEMQQTTETAAEAGRKTVFISSLPSFKRHQPLYPAFTKF